MTKHKTLDDFMDNGKVVSKLPEPEKIEKKIEANEPKLKKKNNIKFELSNGFALDFGQVARLLQTISSQNKDQNVNLKTLSDVLGLPDRRIKGICSLTIALGLITPRNYHLTDMGELVVNYDPFFDDIGTLLMCHYLISYEPRWVVWNVLVNNVLGRVREINRAQIKKAFNHLEGKYSENTLKKKLSGEIRVLLDAYTQQSFHRLGLITSENGSYIAHKAQDVPELILLVSILLYRERYVPKTSALQIETLASAPNSPGRVFNLEESVFRQILEKLHQKGYIYIESSADLDQVRFKKNICSKDVIEEYYEGARNG